jgi:fructokinase
MHRQEFPQFVAAGEALTDMIREDGQRWISQVGGSTWNVARVMARLGVSSGFAGAISEDVFGDALWNASEQAGLDLRFLQRVNKSPLLAMVVETAPPKYFFVGDNSADLYFSHDQLPQQWMRHCRWVHFGGISLAREPLASNLVSLAKSLKASGVKISFDPNFRNLMDQRYDRTFRQMVELAEIVKVSDEDLAGLFRSKETQASFALMRSWNLAASYLYTKGEIGASFYKGEEEWHVAAPKIEVIDTVGAGDASIASLIFSLLRDPHAASLQHLRFAVAGGAVACQSSGASPPDLGSIKALLQKMP